MFFVGIGRRVGQVGWYVIGWTRFMGNYVCSLSFFYVLGCTDVSTKQHLTYWAGQYLKLRGKGTAWTHSIEMQTKLYLHFLYAVLAVQEAIFLPLNLSQPPPSTLSLTLLMRLGILPHKLVSSVLQLGFTWPWTVWSDLLALRPRPRLSSRRRQNFHQGNRCWKAAFAKRLLPCTHKDTNSRMDSVFMLWLYFG